MLNNDTIDRTFFVALLVVVTIAFAWLVRGFLQPVFWAVAIGIVAFPVHEWIERKFGVSEPSAARKSPAATAGKPETVADGAGETSGTLMSPGASESPAMAAGKRGSATGGAGRSPGARKSLAALASMLLVLLVVILPLAGIIAAVTAEAAALYTRLVDGDVDPAAAYRFAAQNAPVLLALLESVGIDPERLQAQLSSGAVEASRFIATRALAIGQDTVRVTLFFFLMIYLLFFFLRDGRRILDGVVHALPLGDERERHLLARFAEVSRATIKGTFVVGLVQGAIGGAAFAVLGIGAPVLWGVVMALLSIVPAVGPALIWAPAAIILIAGGDIVSGIVLVAVGVFIIGLVDNLLRPVLVGRDTRMPDYLILLSTLGGLVAFGLAGVVIGPIVAAFFLSVWAMAAEEFNEDPTLAVAAADLSAGVSEAVSSDSGTGADTAADGSANHGTQAVAATKISHPGFQDPGGSADPGTQAVAAADTGSGEDIDVAEGADAGAEPDTARNSGGGAAG